MPVEVRVTADIDPLARHRLDRYKELNSDYSQMLTQFERSKGIRRE